MPGSWLLDQYWWHLLLIVGTTLIKYVVLRPLLAAPHRVGGWRSPHLLRQAFTRARVAVDETAAWFFILTTGLPLLGWTTLRWLLPGSGFSALRWSCLIIALEMSVLTAILWGAARLFLRLVQHVEVRGMLAHVRAGRHLIDIRA